MIIYVILTILCIGIAIVIVDYQTKEYQKLENEVFEELGITNWEITNYYDEIITVKSRQTLENYNEIKFFQENKEKLANAINIINNKNEICTKLKNFLYTHKYDSRFRFDEIKEEINKNIQKSYYYRIRVDYISYAGNHIDSKKICLQESDINKFIEDPTLLMNKTEYNLYLKEKLDKKHHQYYDKVNQIIDIANKNRDTLIIKNDQKQLDDLVTRLFDRTVNSINKIKTIDSQEWELIEDFIFDIKKKVETIICNNQEILKYYDSESFSNLKKTCDALMKSQKDFNQYIKNKAESISRLFGTKIIRNETINKDEYRYIRPYKKTITPFTAEVSSTVFASAENNPLEYIIKSFYPNKINYPEQIRKLHLLIEELETLKDAKIIIYNYKKEYQKYLNNVPNYIMRQDESGFYSRLGFANIDEDILTTEYKFSYTSGGGMVQRSFSVPMTEENILKLIQLLESKLTMKDFSKEQRNLLTKKLRDKIKMRDNFTCCTCGNSIYKEKNLLLEIDHIVPISKGGYTIEENLQTLCWKCNRSKGSKILY